MIPVDRSFAEEKGSPFHLYPTLGHCGAGRDPSGEAYTAMMW